MLANKLLEKEVIFKEDLEEIFGKRKFDDETFSEEIREVENKAQNSSENEFKSE